MSNQLTFGDKAGLDKWFLNFRQNYGLSGTYTNSMSMCGGPADLSKYLSLDPKTDKEKDAYYSQAMIDSVRHCAPLYECAWNSCTGMVERGLKWFKDNTAITLELDKIYDVVKRKEPSLSELNAYQGFAIKWREDTKYGINELTGIAEGETLTKYAVPGNIILDVQTMLKDMIRRRNLILGSAPTRSNVQPEHITFVEAWVNGHTHAAALPPWGSIEKRNVANHTLLATGLCKLMQTKDERAIEKATMRAAELETMLQDPDKHGLDKETAYVHLLQIRASIEEAKNMGVDKTAMMSQAANMDVPFSSYYWMYKAGVTSETFPSLSQFLFELGTQARGKDKMTKILNCTPFKWGKGIIKLFADNTFEGNRLYLHPLVLTTGRMSDLGAAFGAFPVAYPGRVVEGSGFPRYILNLKTSSPNPCAETIVKLFQITKTYYPNYEGHEVIPSEHLLHQSFIGKKGPFLNVSKVKGTATNVQIVSG
ncbi:nucleoprotein [Tillamook virus]|uniref:Nucleoprotein n=1 Tax=Tillamook virus TaxID=37297 RepID=A0A191KWE0_9VIRU|nr:nucleoprotein [Tillamook virus]